MFKFTRKTDYALVALGALSKEKVCRESPMSARQISIQYDLPLPLLMQLLKTLHKSGVLGSARGAGGGYYLAQVPDQISLTRVIEAIEGPISVVPCCDDAEVEPCVTCRLADRCPIAANIQRVNEAITAFLDQIKISELLGPTPIDFTHVSFDAVAGLVGPPAATPAPEKELI